jgi:hypothetical protein
MEVLKAIEATNGTDYCFVPWRRKERHNPSTRARGVQVLRRPFPDCKPIVGRLSETD